MDHTYSCWIIDIKAYWSKYRFYDTFISNIAYPILETQYLVWRWINTHHEENVCCCTSHPRMFLTKEEKINSLNKYKEWLENEAKGVDEAIAKLKEQ